MKKILLAISLMLLVGCTPLIQVPNLKSAQTNQSILVPETVPTVIPVPTSTIATIKCPDEPSRHLEELTKGLTEDQKLAVVLAANKATIENLEAALGALGVKCPAK